MCCCLLSILSTHVIPFARWMENHLKEHITTFRKKKCSKCFCVQQLMWLIQPRSHQTSSGTSFTESSGLLQQNSCSWLDWDQHHLKTNTLTSAGICLLCLITHYDSKNNFFLSWGNVSLVSIHLSSPFEQWHRHICSPKGIIGKRSVTGCWAVVAWEGAV